VIKKAIRDTLEDVPVKYVQEWVKTDEVTRDQLLEEKIRISKEMFVKGDLYVSRIWPGYVRDKTGVSQQIEQINHNNKAYRLSWWPDDDDDYTIEKQEWIEISGGDKK
jgi:hypothetical protein